ncbi:protein kinase [Gemmata sp. G18]|uniref:Protein kinase n=1 Tax=Gemmata palustris TaxID=2822762 RepID=A0ABS5BX56_9BACT|nr:serine/threonine-protein kinase [Gemmata palustris]MBP3958245.1 protein kinase [Gemmata palustris]
MLGARVGNWFVEVEIGRGPLGVVYRARGFDEPERFAAVKVFTEVRDPAAVQRISAELLPLQRLDHANIAKALDCGTHGGLAFVATEFIDGTDCAKRLESGRLPWREVLSVAVQAARALKHAHNRNVLHRDLKPAHLVLTDDGTLKVLAFGLAKVFPPPPGHSPAIGSSAYLPPEAASGKPLTRRSDLYSLGGVLYTLATGRPPFSAGSVVELMHKQCYTLPERPALLVNDLPPEVDEFICTLLDKNPARRPGTAGALLEELERIRGKLERKGEKLTWPMKLTPDTAEMAALPAALGGVGEGAEAQPETRPLFKRPAIVIPLFLLVVAALVLPFAWPSPSADELFSSARPLIESENPDDWDAAEKYLEPLARKYPDRYKDEVADARRKVKDRRELRRAIGDGAKADPRTDAARGYLRGLRLAQIGEHAQARAAWDGVVTAFGPVKSEARWVELARAGLALLAQPGAQVPHQLLDREPVRAALERAKELDTQGRGAEARAIRDALLALAEGDPVVRQMVEDARKK